MKPELIAFLNGVLLGFFPGVYVTLLWRFLFYKARPLSYAEKKYPQFRERGR